MQTTSSPYVTQQQQTSSWTKIILGIIGFLAFGGLCAYGGYIYAGAKNTNRQYANNIITPFISPTVTITSTPRITPSLIPSPNPTSSPGLQTYSDTNNHVSFQYPSLWTNTDIAPSSMWGAQETTEVNFTDSQSTQVPIGSAPGTMKRPNNSFTYIVLSVPMETYMQDLEANNSDAASSATTIDNKPAQIILMPGGGDSGSQTEYVFPINTNTTGMIYYIPSSQKDPTLIQNTISSISF